MNIQGTGGLGASFGSEAFGDARGDSIVKSAEAARIAAADAEESGDMSKIDDVAEKFEALLSTMLVKEMRKALPNGVFGQGAGADVFEGWFDEHIGNALAKGGDGLDLAGVIKANLGAKTEVAQALPSSLPVDEPSEDA